MAAPLCTFSFTYAPAIFPRPDVPKTRSTHPSHTSAGSCGALLRRKRVSRSSSPGIASTLRTSQLFLSLPTAKEAHPPYAAARAYTPDDSTTHHRATRHILLARGLRDNDSGTDLGWAVIIALSCYTGDACLRSPLCQWRVDSVAEPSTTPSWHHGPRRARTMVWSSACRTFNS